MKVTRAKVSIAEIGLIRLITENLRKGNDNTSTGRQRYRLPEQYKERNVPPEGVPSWSWISQCRNGRKITFSQHPRQPLSEEAWGSRPDAHDPTFGVRYVSSAITQPPAYRSNPFGGILRAVLVVEAVVKWAWAEHIGPALVPLKFGSIDYIFDPLPPYILARVVFDDPATVFRGKDRVQILCVLCSVSKHSSGAAGRRKVTAIAVMPSLDESGRYRRVGILHFWSEYNDWFGHVQPGLDPASGEIRHTWELAEGASQATLELI